jgi:hypothetical protein
MHRDHEAQMKSITRRHFFRNSGVGLGRLALAGLVDPSLWSRGARAAALDRSTNPLAPQPTHFPAKAKNVIYLHMAGSPPQLDLWDYKPKLQELNGQPCPDSLFKTERFAFIKGVPKMLGTPYKFARHGEAGTEVCELLPNIATVVDDIAVVRSMNTSQFNHAPAQMFLYTGSPLLDRPSMGSWLTYGIGSECQDLPGFVVLVSGGNKPSAGASAWGSGFLPSVYQGVQCRSEGEPVLYVTNPEGMDSQVRRRSLDALKDLNQMSLDAVGDPEVASRIAQYELAYRMQSSVPEAMDINREPKAIHDLYGAQPGKTAFANNCLLARRLVERGVRFVQLFDWGWDCHGTNPSDDIVHHLPNKCRQIDRPIAALLKDLKQRGLLDETLVVWGGEFGRTPMNEFRNGSKYFGRDHHPHAFTIFMAGGGVKPGLNYGSTDELGYHITENKVFIHDLQATILHLLGLDHTKLTYKFQGRDFRLTDVHGEVVRDLIG